MRLRTSLAVGMLVATAALAALAQTRPRGGAPKPKPKADAGTTEAVPEDAGASSAAAAPSGAPPPAAGSVADAGAAPSQAFPVYYDGGQKPSPLNPSPNEFPGAPPPVSSAAIDYDKLLGDISTLRARVAMVQDVLFLSRIAIALQTEGDHAKLARLVVSLDDGVVFTADRSFRPEEMRLVYDHAVAPGRHALTVDVERNDDRQESFSNAQRSRFVVDVPKDQRVSVEVRVIDDSTMGADFPGDRSGKYELRVRAKVSARPAGK